MITRFPAPRDALFRLGLLFVVSIPFVIGIAQTILAAREPFFTYGDDALIDIAVRNATQLDQLLGAYSRFGWNHPGPLYFYLLAPFYPLIDSPLRIYLGALFVNWIVSLACVVIAVRRHGTGTGAAVAAVLAVLLLALGPEFLRSPWNPAMMLLPLFMAIVAAVLRPSAATISVGVVGVSIAFQAHVSSATMIAVLAAVVVSAHLVSRLGPSLHWIGGHDGRAPLFPTARSTAIVLAVGLLCWLPTIVEQLTSRPGNLRALFAFFRRAGGHHPIDEVARHLSSATWLPDMPYITFAADPPLRGLPYLAVLVAFGVGAAVLGWRRRNRTAFLAAVFTVAGTPVGLLSLTRVDDTLLPYVFWWAPVLTAGVLLAGASLAADYIAERPTRPLGSATAGVFVALAIALTALSVDARPLESRQEVADAWSAVEQRLPERGSTVLIEAIHPEVSDVASGLAVMLRDQGYEIDVPPHVRQNYGRAPDDDREPVAAVIEVGSGEAQLRPGAVRVGPGQRTAVRIQPA